MPKYMESARLSFEKAARRYARWGCSRGTPANGKAFRRAIASLHRAAVRYAVALARFERRF
jgi:hypothetical protein